MLGHATPGQARPDHAYDRIRNGNTVQNLLDAPIEKSKPN